MKREDILEAIGAVDQSLIAETEGLKQERRSSVMWKICAAAAIVAAMSVTALAAVKLLSRPVESGGVAVGTVAPFSMDNNGNIIMEPVTGWKVAMDVEFDEDAPETLEEVYHLLPSALWEFQHDSVRNDDLLEDNENLTVWVHANRPGQLRLSQKVAGYYGLEGENVVDCLQDLPLDTKLKTEIVTIADRQVLKLTIPVVKIEGMLDQNVMYCEEGEVRLYWTDGKYLLQLDYPIWVPEKEVETMLDSMFTTKHVEVYPDHWGKIEPERIAGMDPVFALDEVKTGTTAVNDTMTVGMMACEDGTLYLSASGGIFQYEIETGEYAFLETEEYSLPRNIFLTDNYICYTDNIFGRHGLYCVSKDGSKRDYVYEGISIGSLRVVGSKLYGIDADELKSIDLETGEIETLAENVNRYFIDDNYLYILPTKGNYFLKSNRNDVRFEKYELTFQPISMVSDGEDLYFTVGGQLEEGQRRYQIVRYSGGVETKLPIYSVRMQILNGKLVYAEESDSSIIKTYDLTSGETECLQENVFDFYVCEDGRIVFHYLYNDGWGILDMETGELTKVEHYPE